jgi:transcriptional regulator with XRE-family HTH domain
MLPLAHLIRETRVGLGMTQSELSRRASVSLPSVQTIESGRAENPSLETLSSILKTLGLEMTVAPREPDWNALIACGAPLTVSKGRRPQPSAELLLDSLRSACLYFSHKKESSRERVSLEALLLAIKSYYPSFYRKHCARSSLFNEFLPKELTGSLIKLKRQASFLLAEYL